MGNLTIKNWAEEDRPREKMLIIGVRELSDAELLAILLQSGTQNMTAVELAREILNIAENNFDQIWANLLHSMLETGPSYFRNSLINAIFQLCQKNIIEI